MFTLPPLPQNRSNFASSSVQAEEQEEGNFLLQHPSFLLHDFILAAKQDDLSALRVLSSSLQDSEISAPRNSRRPRPRRRRRLAARRRALAKVAQSSKLPKDVTHLGDLEDSEGWTPLHSACESRSEAAVVYLLSEGCSPNKPAGDHYRGVTPMHMACLGGHMGILSAMIAAGGTLLAPSTTGGVLPVDMASFSSFPSKELIDIIFKHSGIRIKFDDDHDLTFGPQLSSKSYFSLERDIEAGTYVLSGEREIKEAIFRTGLPELSSFKSAVEAAWAVVDFARPLLVSTDDDKNSSTILGAEEELPERSTSPVPGLSDSFADLISSRENDMIRSDHATNILDSVLNSDKENLLPSVSEEEPEDVLCLDLNSDSKNDVPDEIDTGKPAAEEDTREPVAPEIQKEKPLVKRKQARFAPDIESPIWGRVRIPHKKLGQHERRPRHALADITPPQHTTPTRDPCSGKPPTPYPIRSDKQSILKRMEGLQLGSRAAGEKENAPSKTNVKHPSLPKLRPRTRAYKLVPNT